MRQLNCCLTLMIMAWLSSPCSAMALPSTDKPGAQDHPLVSRYEGAVIVAYQVQQYDETWLPTGPVDSSKKPPFKSVLNLEGKITNIAYNFPADRSALEVMRNYTIALEKAGFKNLFSCSKESCNGLGRVLLHEKKFLDANNGYWARGSSEVWSPFNYGATGARYLVSSAQRSNGSTVYVGIEVCPPEQGQNGGVFIEVVEPKAMETNKVTANLSADEMSKRIAAEGKVAIYGIYFDVDKAEIKPESNPTLAEMAKLMKNEPKLQVYIVGHTDNVGTLAHNVELSQKRADAVRTLLITTHQIDPNRLVAKGVASFAPVDTNRTETGRAKNRRVELVEQ